MDPIYYNARLRAAPLSAEEDGGEAMRHVSEAVRRINAAISSAVDSGISVELVRHSRCHDQKGNWGDQVMPAILKSPAEGSGQGSHSKP
jgi:hypothetical protein